ncbi:MAG: hypothetical protein HYX73_01635 [Acidobacteria bacterium]|nr:hypothetical protein [Acidobacteriota bacterium]
MIGKNMHGHRRIYPQGLLRQFYLRLRGTEQILVRPAAELPLVLISYAKGDFEGMEHLKESIEETWMTLPDTFRKRYADVLRQVPPFVVVLLRRRNLCTCLGHHHPPGSESRLTRRLRSMSGIATGEIDLAYEAIREWEPQPLSFPALPSPADTEEFLSFQWQLALLAVFLHELHHLVSRSEPETVVRGQSQKFYEDVLSHFVSSRFGVQYGLRHVEESSTGAQK